MSVPKALEAFLHQQDAGFERIPYRFKGSVRSSLQALGVKPGQVALTAVLKDGNGLMLTIYPATSSLNIDAINRKLNRSFMPITNAEIKQVLEACESGICAPLAEMYGIGVIIDNALMQTDSVFFPISKQAFIRISGEDFMRLQGDDVQYDDIVYIKDDGGLMVKETPAFVGDRRKMIREKLQYVEGLPTIPRIASEILQLSNNPYANAVDLAAIIEQDPSLAAQLLRYANSPFYGYKGDVESIHDAISRVLGFDMVLDMALGIAVGKAFRNPNEGPIGLNEFWRHAVYCAVLTQRLSKEVRGTVVPRPGMAYLCGLLHNFGLLLEGHFFPKDYARLNRMIGSQPDETLVELEEQVLGVTHMESGSWLMEAWDMPGEIVTTIREHHNPDYEGMHSVYSCLVLLSNRLLKSMLIGDESKDEIPKAVLEKLKLDEETVQEIFQNMIDNRIGLDFMALQMAA